ncbi:hypothetical protein B566_EDAN002084 [Ephemera danica]|nr:hypothetical protein B566_EDAN002084 [Ephemera danica]
MALFRRLLTARSVILNCSRSSAYLGSKLVEPGKYTDVETSTAEWRFVERLLPSKRIPDPPVREFYPSGWIPPRPEINSKFPYFVERTKCHLTPVYLATSHRGMRRITLLRRIRGDVWQLQADLDALLKEKFPNQPPATQLNELQCRLRIKGDHVALVNKFLLDRGF